MEVMRSLEFDNNNKSNLFNTQVKLYLFNFLV